MGSGLGFRCIMLQPSCQERPTIFSTSFLLIAFMLFFISQEETNIELGQAADSDADSRRLAFSKMMDKIHDGVAGGLIESCEFQMTELACSEKPNCKWGGIICNTTGL